MAIADSWDGRPLPLNRRFAAVDAAKAPESRCRAACEYRVSDQAVEVEAF